MMIRNKRGAIFGVFLSDNSITLRGVFFDQFKSLEELLLRVQNGHYAVEETVDVIAKTGLEVYTGKCTLCDLDISSESKKLRVWDGDLMYAVNKRDITYLKVGDQVWKNQEGKPTYDKD